MVTTTKLFSEWMCESAQRGQCDRVHDLKIQILEYFTASIMETALIDKLVQ